VAERSVRIEPSDRAQLMLVGAVAIALVIVGIVVVYNTVLYSDTQTASGTTNDARQAEAFSQQVRTDLRTLGGELKRGGNLSEPNLTRAVRNWSAVQSRVHANTDPAFVAIDPGNCSGICTSGSQFNATVIWESQDFEYSDSVDVRIPFSGVGSTVYAVNPSGRIIAVDGNASSVATYTGTTGVSVLGPASVSVDNDGATEVPYVNATGALQLTEPPGPGDTLVPSGVDSSGSRLAVGRWDGSPTSVFYVNNDAIFRATKQSGSVITSLVRDLSTSDGVTAIAGIADIDNDSNKELVHVDGSQTVRYLDSVTPGCGGPGGGSCPKMGVNPDVQTSGGGVGVGPPVDFDGDGSASLVATNTDGPPAKLKLIGTDTASGESTQTITSVNDVAAAPMTIADVDSDGLPEIVYVQDTSTLPSDRGYVKYVDDVRNGNDVRYLRDGSGNRIVALIQAGVSGS
jgi:hypothetical protein